MTLTGFFTEISKLVQGTFTPSVVTLSPIFLGLVMLLVACFSSFLSYVITLLSERLKRSSPEVGAIQLEEMMGLVPLSDTLHLSFQFDDSLNVGSPTAAPTETYSDCSLPTVILSRSSNRLANNENPAPATSNGAPESFQQVFSFTWAEFTSLVASKQLAHSIVAFRSSVRRTWEGSLRTNNPQSENRIGSFVNSNNLNAFIPGVNSSNGHFYQILPTQPSFPRINVQTNGSYCNLTPRYSVQQYNNHHYQQIRHQNVSSYQTTVPTHSHEHNYPYPNAQIQTLASYGENYSNHTNSDMSDNNSYGTHQVEEETGMDQQTSHFRASTPPPPYASSMDQLNDREQHSSVSTENVETDDVSPLTE